MGDLAGSQTEGSGIRRSTLRPGCDGAAVAQRVGNGTGEQSSSIPRVMSAMSSLSGDTIVSAGVSNGGAMTTDLAETSSSEVGNLTRGGNGNYFVVQLLLVSFLLFLRILRVGNSA